MEQDNWDFSHQVMTQQIHIRTWSVYERFKWRGPTHYMLICIWYFDKMIKWSWSDKIQDHYEELMWYVISMKLLLFPRYEFCEHRIWCIVHLKKYA